MKSVYVNALLEQLNRYNEEIDSSNEHNLAPNPTSAPNPTLAPNPKTDRTDRDPVKVNKSNRCEACGRSDKSNGCGDCDQWRSKYKEQKKCRIKLSLKYTDLMLKYDELVQVAKGMAHHNKNSEKVLNQASQAILDSDEASQAIFDTDGASQAMSTSNGASQAMPASDGASQTTPASGKASQAMSASDRVSQPVSIVSEIFTDNEIKCLQCIPLDKKKDSTFVMHCIENAYQNNRSDLWSFLTN